MKESRFKLHYRGSLFWLIFWFIVFFPIAFVLLFTASTFEFNKTTYNLQYNGSRFWLCFWVLFFFPIAGILLFVNGFSASMDRGDVGQQQSSCCKIVPNKDDDKGTGSCCH